jgi:probable LLM family oxidoreductase
MEIGIDSFAAIIPDPQTGKIVPATDRMAALLEEIDIAESVGIDVFGVGEHHREEFLDSAPAIILAAAAARTKRIRLTSAVTVLSAADPVRVFQDFATADLISRGRMEIIVGRGSFGEAFPLYGFDKADYDALFSEKLELLLKLREQPAVHWKGQFRPALNGEEVYPRPHQQRMPIWLGVGGSPESAVRAGKLGLPLMLGIIGGSFDHFFPLVQLYRETGVRSGFSPDQLRVGVHAMGFLAETDKAAKEAFFPGWAQMFNQVGGERGWPPVSRAQFETMCEPGGAFLIGSPETVIRKIDAANRGFGGISRFTFQMSTAALNIAAMRTSIQLVGEKVIPNVRQAF